MNKADALWDACRASTGSRAAKDAPNPSGAVTPALLRRGAAIIQDMAVIIAETVAESYLADAGLARGGTALQLAAIILCDTIAMQFHYIHILPAWPQE